MTKTNRNHLLRSLAIFLMAGCLIVSFGSATIVGPLPLDMTRRNLTLDMAGTHTLKDMARLGLLQRVSETDAEELLTYQASSGKSLVDVLREPLWAKRMGLSASMFKATWYASNPYDLLPVDLQIAIRKTQKPFASRTHINRWLKAVEAPQRWVEAIDLALVETTPENLWRASRGKRPFAKNGQYLQPIVVEQERGIFDVRDGHIATDPHIIPTNTRLLIVIRVNGEDRIIQAKATDIGEAIKGRHVDLPISIKPRYTKDHAIQFPGDYIRNPNVLILIPNRKFNRDRKA